MNGYKQPDKCILTDHLGMRSSSNGTISAGSRRIGIKTLHSTNIPILWIHRFYCLSSPSLLKELPDPSISKLPQPHKHSHLFFLRPELPLLPELNSPNTHSSQSGQLSLRNPQLLAKDLKQPRRKAGLLNFFRTRCQWFLLFCFQLF